jgi:hypothetical protein
MFFLLEQRLRARYKHQLGLEIPNPESQTNRQKARAHPGLGTSGFLSCRTYIITFDNNDKASVVIGLKYCQSTFRTATSVITNAQFLVFSANFY